MPSLDQKTESKEVSDSPSAVEEQNSNPEAPVPQAAEGVNTSHIWDPVSDEDWTATIVGSTPGGKEVQVTRREGANGFKVGFNTGAPLPVEFQGWFTSYAKAEQAGRLYLNKKWEKHAKSAANETAA